MRRTTKLGIGSLLAVISTSLVAIAAAGSEPSDRYRVDKHATNRSTTKTARRAPDGTVSASESFQHRLATLGASVGLVPVDGRLSALLATARQQQPAVGDSSSGEVSVPTPLTPVETKDATVQEDV